MRKISQAALLAAAFGLAALYAVPGALAQDTSKEEHSQIDLSVSSPDDQDSSASDDSSSSAEDVTPIDNAENFTATVTVQSVAAVDSSMDEGAIRDAIGPNFLKHTDEFAHLNATSITIPEIDLVTTTAETTNNSAYKDIVLSNVQNGLVATMTIGSISSTGTPKTGSPVTFSYKTTTYQNVDIDALFAFLGLVKDDTVAAGKPAIGHFESTGGSLVGDSITCDIGKFSGDGTTVKASPIAFDDVVSAFQALQAAKGDAEPPQPALMTVIKYVGNLLRDFASTTTHLDGLNCQGHADGNPYSFGLGGIDVGSFHDAIYPDINVHDVKVDMGEQGKLSLDALTFKAIDLNPPLDALMGADTLDKGWFDKNGRLLVPSWNGLSLSGLALDVPDPTQPGARITANAKGFDLTLSDYLNGIPTKISTTADGVDVPLPPDSTDDTLKMLESLGLTRVNLGFAFSAAWDKATQSINIDKFSLSGEDLGSAAVAIAIGNASEQLFDLSTDVETAAGMAVTLKSVKVDMTDSGIGDKLAAELAKENGGDPAAFRTQLAGTAEAVVLQMLGATPTAQALANAVGTFVTGSSKSVSVTMTSKDPAGLTLPVLAAAQNDPTVLTNAVDITGSAQ